MKYEFAKIDAWLELTMYGHRPISIYYISYNKPLCYD